MIQLLEVAENPYPAGTNNKYYVREIYLSPEHIIMVREDGNMKRLLAESTYSPQADALMGKEMRFSKLTINRGSAGQDVTVVGSVEVIYSKIEESKIKTKKILRG
jgi:hypothetical protein